MRTAQEIPLAAADPGEQVPHQRYLIRLARVRGATQCQLLSADAEPVHHSIIDERQGLEGLRGRAPVGDEVGVSGPGEQATGRVHDGDVDIVPGLDERAPRLLDPHRLVRPTDNQMPTSRRIPPTRALGVGTSWMAGTSQAISVAPTGSPRAATFTVVARKCWSA